MSDREVVLCQGVRTPRGKGWPGGKLADTAPVQLVAHVLVALRDRGLDPWPVGDLILGCATQVVDQGANIARTASLAAGCDRVAGMTVSRGATSGLESIAIASALCGAGQYGVVIAGGVESASRAPATGELPAEELRRGVAADMLATLLGHGRMELDEYADTTRRKAQMAYAAGAHVKSLVPTAGLAFDEFLDGMPDLDTLRAMPPFQHLHTRGSSAQPADAAAVVVVADRAEAERFGLQPRVIVRATARVTVEPDKTLTAGVTAVARVLAKWMLSTDQVDVFSFGEAFSSPCLHFMKTYGVDHERFNPNGGTLALGDAVGATGTILVLDVIDTLERRNGRYGVAAISGTDGTGTAILFERVA